MKFEPTVFDPGVARIKEITEITSQVIVDPAKASKEQYDLVVATRKRLVTLRTTLNKIGKKERDTALKFQRDVITYEKSLIALIAVEETRIKKLEEDIKLCQLRVVRKEAIAELIAKLDKLGDGITTTEDELLAMDTNTFDNYYAQRVAAWHDNQEDLKRDKAFKVFLSENDFDDTTDMIQGDDLYRKVATFSTLPSDSASE